CGDRLPQGDIMTSLKEHIRNIEKAVKKHKKENKGKHFTFVPPDEIERRLKRANTPIIHGISWKDLVKPGQTIHYGLVATSDEEDQYDRPACSALEFGAASNSMAADSRHTANETGWQSGFFVCCVR